MTSSDTLKNKLLKTKVIIYSDNNILSMLYTMEFILITLSTTEWNLGPDIPRIHAVIRLKPNCSWSQLGFILSFSILWVIPSQSDSHDLLTVWM